MKTIIEQANGVTYEYDGYAPSVSMDSDDGSVLVLVDADMQTLGDDIPLSEIKKVTFEP